jgi:hypothetical protein
MTGDVNHVDVLLVADDGDPHCTAVDARLQTLGTKTLRLNLSDVPSRLLISKIGALDIAGDGGWARVDGETTVWWFRAGSVRSQKGIKPDEQQLIADEAPAIFVGALRAAGVRWVDDPDIIRRAEWKLSQLAVAAALGITTPPWTVTNSPDAARQLADGHVVVAKPLSSGHGIAPFTAAVLTEDLDRPGDLATLFQRRVDANADVRVVVIDGQTWAWRRAREANTVDWRAVDSTGRGFCRIPVETWRDPSRLTSALGLTISVQDWLETAHGPVFLEANPQGSWLFLDGAEKEIGHALATYLRDGAPETAGTWPVPRRRVFYDFLTKARAPDNDGMIAPMIRPPVWADEVSAIPGALDIARSARETAEDAAKSAEDKAFRLVQVTLALLTVALALGSYQLTFALQRSWPWLLLLIPVAAALCCLAVAAFEGLLVDRVGFYSTPTGQDLAGLGQRNPDAVVLAQEERGRRLARWSAAYKHTDLMQARAWFTRGLAVLLLAGALAGACRAASSAFANTKRPADHASPTSPHGLTSTRSPALTPGSDNKSYMRRLREG